MTPGEEHWLQTRWRPITAIVYLVICCFDFIIFPVLWSLFLFFSESNQVTVSWDPLTLKGAGLFHLAFGAILGVSAFTRGQEKVNRLQHDYPRYEEPDHEEPPSNRRRKFEPPRR
jgi:hypothetical protein